MGVMRAPHADRTIPGLRAAFAGTHAFRSMPAPVPGRPLALCGLAGSAKALLAAVLRETAGDALLVCCGDDVDADEWVEDLGLFSPPAAHRPAPRVLPELERDEELEPVAASLRARRAALRDVAPGEVVIAEIAALMAPVAAPSEHEAGQRITLRRGLRIDPAQMLATALAAGMRRVPQVLERGEVALRGDVLDVFPETGDVPLRVELFDDEIESLRRFDPLQQTSTDELDEAVLVLPDPSEVGGPGASAQAFPLDLLDPAHTLVLVVEPVRFEEQLSRFTIRSGSLSPPVAAFQCGLARFRSLTLSTLPVPGGHDLGARGLALATSQSWDLKGRLVAASALGTRPLVVLRSRPEVERLERLAREMAGGGEPAVDATTGHLARGFRLEELGRCLLNHGEFFGTGVARRRSTGSKLPSGARHAEIQSRALDSFFELASGDYVVHAVHGIARFLGIERTARGTAGGAEDHLRLVFANDVEVLVPASRIDLVQKYIGAGGDVVPKLDKLGSKSFARRKREVAEALRDMAAELLEIQIARERSPGFACPKEDPLYDDFVASFPFTDTKDQERATREILQDLVKPRPMDRLLCGDVGFGKTEIAMRAAFRVASAGRQVAMLVPTTLLCEQHGRTFRDRFASFPVRIELLSRFQTPKQRKEILKATASGQADILIGTHRLLAKEVVFQDLGLLVIDEEQRFGVAHKEKIRALRANVDVLTLTATPIPRTLHMSLLGIKDISSLATPPPGRLEIETQVVHRQARVIREAILRELARGGQVFFLHNRVHDIEVVRAELQDLVPEARFVVGHGQLGERELLDAMHTFLSGNADVLLSTTIVESGIDIPRANTILVDHAHTFGLADLHQLRGRVGRDLHKAHCLLLVDPSQPLTLEAKRRLQAMERFAGLGAGFQIAMRDLEIRGAGNLLGPEQSGHIAAIGYDMYCRLLQASVERAAGGRPVADVGELATSGEVEVDLGVEAFLPESLIDEPRQRLALLREMDTATDLKSVTALARSLHDRFGRLPSQVRNLLRLFVAKHQLGSRGITVARFVPPDQLVLSHAAQRAPQGSWVGEFADVRRVTAERTCLVLPRKVRKPEAVLEHLVAALLGQRPEIA